MIAHLLRASQNKLPPSAILACPFEGSLNNKSKTPSIVFTNVNSLSLVQTKNPMLAGKYCSGPYSNLSVRLGGNAALHSAISTTNGFTYQCDIYATDFTGNPCILSYQSSGRFQGYLQYFGAGTITWYPGGAGNWNTGSTVVQTGRWHRVTFELITPNNTIGYAKIWVDGVIVLNTSKLADIQFTSASNFILGSYYAGSNAFNGYIKNVIYTKETGIGPIEV